MSKRAIILGAGGHASVVAEAVRCMGMEILGYSISPKQGPNDMPRGVIVLGDDDKILTMDSSRFVICNGIGVRPTSHSPGTASRRRVFDLFSSRGFVFSTVTGSGCVIATDATVEAGAQIMSGAIVQSRAKVSVNAVVNTGSIVEHDCHIGAHAFLSPGVVCCGSVEIGEGAFIGAGAVLLPGIVVGQDAVIGAGAVARKSVAHRECFVG